MIDLLKHTVQSCANATGHQVLSLPQPAVQAPWEVDDLSLYRSLYPSASVEERRFINIGAGDWRHAAWTNIDDPSDWYDGHQERGELIDISWNLFNRDPLLLDDNSIEAAYCSHVVEHVDDASDDWLFREVHRVLKPGGAFRITCPDIELAYDAYLRHDRDFFSWIENYSRADEIERIHLRMAMRDASLEQVFLYLAASSVSELHADGIDNPVSDEEFRELLNSRSLAEALDECCGRCEVNIQQKYPGNHMNWFSYDKLIGMLKCAGFGDAVRSAYGQSRTPVMRNVLYFDYRRPNMSLYVEAQK